MAFVASETTSTERTPALHGVDALLRQEVVLHGEKSRRGACGDADLVVNVLEVVAGRLDRNIERRGDFLVGHTSSDETQDLDLAITQSAGALGLQTRLVPRGAEYGFDRVAIESALPRLFSELVGGQIGKHAGSVGATLGHGLVHVRRPEY